MTEEILQAAIMQLRSKATERFGIIKDLYHRPATTDGPQRHQRTPADATGVYAHDSCKIERVL